MIDEDILMDTEDSVAEATPTAVVLVVEDGAAEREALARVLRLEDYVVLTARNPEHALTLIDQPVDLVVSDLKMGARSGLDLMQMWNARKPDTPFIIITAYGDVESAVTAMKLGARDYLSKPVDPGKLLELVRSNLRQAREKAATAGAGPVGGAATEGPAARGIGKLVGMSAPIDRVRAQVLRVAPTDSTVLVLGESGTGKELVAEAVHVHSARGDQPFVVVNMAAVPEALVESELFGHVKGSFTGATADRIGRFEAADGGTLFIDEIGDFPQASQAKLLRVLENRVVQPVGGNDARPVNVRLVAATSRNLRQMIAEGRFREDLYYRLNVVTIELTPLRDRREDVPVLIEHFVRQLARELRKPMPAISEDLQAFMAGYVWPGNVRQLRNCLERMMVLATEGELTLEDLPADLRTAARLTPASAAVDDASQLDRLEKSVILQTLKRFEGNRTRTAEALGISIRTLQRRLKEWGQ
jgi:DNA-binding NtrC family response regulator